MSWTKGLKMKMFLLGVTVLIIGSALQGYWG